jgi:hypothetical protein
MPFKPLRSNRHRSHSTLTCGKQMASLMHTLVCIVQRCSLRRRALSLRPARIGVGVKSAQ